MQKEAATKIIKETFNSSFDKERFKHFTRNLLNLIEEETFIYRGKYIPDAYHEYVKTLERVGKYKDPTGKKIDILIVNLKKETSLEYARTMQRNFIAWYLDGSRGNEQKDAALVAFASPNGADWRFSLVKMDYTLARSESGRIKAEKELTPARRWSFLVGEYENSHTAQKQLFPILEDDASNPSLNDLEEAFNIEVVTKEFFDRYRDLFNKLVDELHKLADKDKKIKAEFQNGTYLYDQEDISNKEKYEKFVANFAKKLLGQIVFLYFLQKKGWFGVDLKSDWGSGPKDFLRELYDKKHGDYINFFDEILEPLFYEALAKERDKDYYSRFKCRIPFLNGGLFDPLGNYDWVNTKIQLPNELFSNKEKTKQGDIGTGILDVFDRYNFTVKEDEPLEKDVAVDPEMLGKVFENLLEVKDRKSKGTYYTPREIVHYMCQESLVAYLSTELEGKVSKEDIVTLIKYGESFVEHDARVAENGKETATYSYKLPESIRKNAKLIDEKLEEIQVCDPAVGSGAFLVGMMSEIIRTRNALTLHLKNKKDRAPYNFKRHAIQNSLYGVDIDAGAVEIAKLRLWLSLIVDESEFKEIQPLPNLDYKIVAGNSLLSVEKNTLFIQPDLAALKELKQKYFDETSAKKKEDYKNQIDALISKITNGHKEFDFEVYFSEVFEEEGGFDVVIANPPYIDSESMVNEQQQLRTLISQTYTMTKGNWDIYIAFFERGFGILNKKGNLTFITPDKWVSKPFGDEFRKNTIKNLYAILWAGRKVFETANVDSVVSFFKKERSSKLDILDFDDGKIIFRETIQKDILESPFAFDFLASNYLKILIKIESAPQKGSGFFTAENACATSDAYKLKPLIKDLQKRDDFNPENHLKVVNTGTIGKYASKWGYQEMTYLKDKYLFPVVNKKVFLKEFKNSYSEKSVRPKTIVKGLTLLDACLDLDGLVVPGKSTLVVFGANSNDLKLSTAILNSKLTFFYIKEKYPASSYNQGINFTKDMINVLPFPNIQKAEMQKIIKFVDSILGIASTDDYFENEQKQKRVGAYQAKIDQIVYKLYGLTKKEIEIIEQS